jgi:ATP-dependent RNA helicase HelY
MFDGETARLMRQAPALQDVDPLTLPQQLTAIYAELTSFRLRAGELEAAADRRLVLERLQRLGTIYEAVADTGATGDARRAAAFVSATAHQILSRVVGGMYSRTFPLLGPDAIHPLVASPLLFLIAEQNADAREAARPLDGVSFEDVTRGALVETIYDVATERYEEILDRADRLGTVRIGLDETDPDLTSERALYGLCWAGLVHMVAKLLGRARPALQFQEFDTPQATFDRAIRLSATELDLPVFGRVPLSFSGPRHLAPLLRHVADSFEGAGLVGVPPPAGSDPELWARWLRHRAKTKPVLWRNHRAALATGFLDVGKSTVLVLPTGAGKTTVSELKIAATLARDKKVIFLVPTLALVDQLRDELAENFPRTFENVQVGLDGDLSTLAIGMELEAIEVMTPERCLALMAHAPESVADLGLIVFDECHLLSPQGGGRRSLDAMLCLLHAIKKAPRADFLLLSAMLTNAPELAEWLQSATGRPCVAFLDPWKPSRQARGVVVFPASDLTTIRAGAQAYQAARTAGRRARKPPRAATPYGLFGLHQNWNPAAEADTRLLQLLDSPTELGGSGARVTPNANAVAADLAARAAEAGLKTIVFVQQAGHAPSTAKKIADQLPLAEPLTPAEGAMWNDVQAELGGGEFSLVPIGARALAHNGDMLPRERRLVESIYRRGSGAEVIVATPTLAQGMNLPAQLAILAGDKRHEDEGRASLEIHEILNAAGRAGRAGHLANGVVLMIPEPVMSFTERAGPTDAHSRSFGRSFHKTISAFSSTIRLPFCLIASRTAWQILK